MGTFAQWLWDKNRGSYQRFMRQAGKPNKKEYPEMDMANSPVAARSAPVLSGSGGSIFDNIPELDMDWAERHSDRALALLFVSPRPCAALDRLLGL